LLDADEFDEIVNDKQLMQDVQNKMHEMEKILENDDNKMGILFSDMFELNNEVGAYKFIEEQTAYTVDISDKDASRL